MEDKQTFKTNIRFVDNLEERREQEAKHQAKFLIKCLKQEIKALESDLTGDMFADMSTREAIAERKKVLAILEEPLPAKPDDSQYECVGCGS